MFGARNSFFVSGLGLCMTTKVADGFESRAENDLNQDYMAHELFPPAGSVEILTSIHIEKPKTSDIETETELNAENRRSAVSSV